MDHVWGLGAEDGEREVPLEGKMKKNGLRISGLYLLSDVLMCIMSFNPAAAAIRNRFYVAQVTHSLTRINSILWPGGGGADV